MTFRYSSTGGDRESLTSPAKALNNLPISVLIVTGPLR